MNSNSCQNTKFLFKIEYILVLRSSYPTLLVAIQQSTARKNEWPLDRMVLSVDVTKKSKDDFNSAPREGAYIHGLFMEGARWDSQSGLLIHLRLINFFFW